MRAAQTPSNIAFGQVVTKAAEARERACRVTGTAETVTAAGQSTRGTVVAPAAEVIAEMIAVVATAMATATVAETATMATVAVPAAEVAAALVAEVVAVAATEEVGKMEGVVTHTVTVLQATAAMMETANPARTNLCLRRASQWQLRNNSKLPTGKRRPTLKAPHGQALPVGQCRRWHKICV